MSGSDSSTRNGPRSTQRSSAWDCRPRSCYMAAPPHRRPLGPQRQETKMTAVIEARGLTKSYGSNTAVDSVSFAIQPGRIVGLIGPNGAGKTSLFKAILGLTQFEGELSVLGRDPRSERNELMQDVCFIADVAVLPRWLRVSQALDFVAGVHPRFDRSRATDFLRK